MIEIGYTCGMIRDTKPMAPTVLSMLTVERMISLICVDILHELTKRLLTNISIAFGSSVELRDSWNVKPIDELRPNLRTKPITEDQSNLVCLIGGRIRSGQDVPAHFADVLTNLWIEMNRSVTVVYTTTTTRILTCTVQLYFWQSAKYCEAENFLRMTTVAPNRRACPTLIMPPAV